MLKIVLFAVALVAVADPAHAGPVVGAVATWIGSTFAVGAATALAVSQFIVGTGLQIIDGLLAKSQMDKPKVDVQTEIQIGDDAPLSFTVGEYATAGKRKYVKSWGKNTRFITQVIEFSGLPQGLSGIWVDDEIAEIATGYRGNIDNFFGLAQPGLASQIEEVSSGMADAVNVGMPLDIYGTSSSVTDARIWVRVYDGTQTEADPLMVWIAADDPDYPWTANHIGTGKAYAVVTTQYDPDTLTQAPQFLIEPEALPLYDIRKDSTNGGIGVHRWGQPETYEPTNNPAVIAYNIIRGIYFGTEWVFGGKNLPAWRLPSAEWIAAANACDDPVTLQNGSTEPRYRCGMEIRCDMQAADVLEEIGKSANMRFAEVGGRIKPIVDLPATVAFAITDDDIIISEGQSFKPFYPLSETYNAISATYPERAEKWTNRDAVEYIDADATAADGGRYLPTSMSYGAVPFRKQVRRLQRSQMRDFRRMRRHQFTLPPDAFGIEPGIDMISWSSDRNGYANKKFLVESVQRVPGMNVAVSLREVDPSDYDWSSDFEAPTPVVIPKNPVVVIQPISGLSFVGVILEDEDGNARRPAIRVMCDGDEVGVTDIQIQARVTGKATSIDVKRDFGGDYTWYLQNVLGATNYQCRARLLSNRKPVWSLWYDVTTPDVGFSWDDFEQDLRDEIEAALQEAADAADEVNQAQQDIIDIRGDLTTASDTLTAEIAQARTDLGADIDAAETLANDNLNIARAYTDTGLLNESAQRLSGDQALAAQIQTLTAVLNSENYIENARFSDGLTGWVQSSEISVVAQDDNSADPVVADAPTAFFVRIEDGAAASRYVYQDFPIDWEANEVFQWRLHAAANTGGGLVRVELRFFDGSGDPIVPDYLTDITPTAGEWRVFSGQQTPPAGAAAVRVMLRVPYNISTGPVFATDVSFTKVDQSLIARIGDLEVVVANQESAQAAWNSTAIARFQSNEGAIASEASTRATQDGVLSGRIDTVQASAASNAAAITAEATARADQDSALAGQITTVSAAANRARTYRQASTPANPQTGDIWYDTNANSRPKRWSGSAWVDASDSRISQNAAAITSEAIARADQDSALATQINTVSATAAKPRTYRSSVAPSDPMGGDIWYDTSANSRPTRWNGSSWQDASDTRIDSLTATVTTQATAIADLKGNASAGYLIKAQAGGAVSLIDLVAADGSGGPTSIIKLDAEFILLDGTVGANKLVITDPANIVADNQFQTPEAWTLPAGFGLVATTTGWNSLGAVRYIKEGSTGWTSYVVGPEFSMEAGVEYYSSLRAYSGDGQYNVQVLVVFIAYDGSIISSETIVGSGAVDSGATRYSRSFTAPNGTQKARIRIRVYRPDTVGNVMVGDLVIRPLRSGTTLITPGGVTSDLVTAETMKALNGRFGDLRAANIKVGEAEIDTIHIKGDALYVPYLFSRADFQVPVSNGQGNQILAFNRTISDFEGGGFTVSFNAFYDSTLSSDAFGAARLVIDGVQQSVIRFGVRAASDEAEAMFPVILFGTASGNGSTNIRVYVFNSNWNNIGMTSAPYWLRNVQMSVSGTRR